MPHRVAWFAAALFTVGCGCPPAHADGCRLALAASLPLIEADHGTTLLVDATVDGSPVRLILDTGSELIVLNETVARHVSKAIALGTMLGGLAETGKGFVVGVGGARTASSMQIGNLGLGRLHGSFYAVATDESFAFAGAGGALGMSVLGDFDVDLDLPGHQLRLYSASGACGKKPAVALDEPIYAAPLKSGFRTQVRPLLPVVINGQNFTAVLDTGASGILLFAGAASRLGLDGQPGPAAPFKISGVGGGSHATMHRLETLAVGPITLRNIDVAVDSEHNSEADLLLGLSFMRKVHVWISNSSHTLVMQFPPVPSPSLAAN